MDSLASARWFVSSGECALSLLAMEPVILLPGPISS